MQLLNFGRSSRKIRVCGSSLESVSSTADPFERMSRIAAQAAFSCTAEELRAADNVRQFWNLVLKDKTLQKKLMPAERLGKSDAIQFIHAAARDAGFECTMEEFDVITKAQRHHVPAEAVEANDELTVDELAAVAGGAFDAYSTQSSPISGSQSPTLDSFLKYY